MFLLWLRQLAWCRDQTLASVPPPTEGRSIPTETPVFPVVPSSYQVLCGSIYSFPLVRYSCLLSAGVLHVLLCLKVYSWCIHGEMYSMSTYSSAILFQSVQVILINHHFEDWILENGSSCWNGWGRKCIKRTGEGSKGNLIAWVQLMNQWLVMSFPCAPPMLAVLIT